MSETVLLVFARAAGFASRAPGLAHPSVPPPLRAAAAFGLALLLAPSVAAAPPLSPVLFALALAGETLTGALFGWGSALVFDAAYTAGRLIDDAVGIRGSVPTANVAAAQGFGRLWSGTFLAGLFLLDGYVPIVRGFAATFEALPPGTWLRPGALIAFGTAFAGAFAGASLSFALPAVAAAAVAQVATAAVGRVVPRLANLTLAHPLAFAAALSVTLVAIPLAAPSAGRPLLPLFAPR